MRRPVRRSPGSRALSPRMRLTGCARPWDIRAGVSAERSPMIPGASRTGRDRHDRPYAGTGAVEMPMSSASLSPHIPDLDLITYYAEKGDSIFSRSSPWTKGCLLVFVVLLVTVSRSLVLLLGLYLIVLLL